MKNYKVLAELGTYRRYGFNLIPCAYGTKQPTFYWKICQTKKITFPDSAFYDKNVAVVTGSISQLMVIDIDGEIASELFKSRIEASPLAKKVKETLGVKTGKGYHFYFHVEFDVPSFVLAETDSGEIRIKANGGVVIGAGSLHPNGKFYKSNRKDLQTLTEGEYFTLLSLFEKTGKEGGHTQGKPNAHLKPMFKINARGYVVKEGNNRHEDTLRKCESLITKLYGIVPLADIKTVARDWNEKHCSPPLPATEFERQWKCALKYIVGEGHGYIQRKLYRRAGNPLGRFNKDVENFIVLCRQNASAVSVFEELKRITNVSEETLRKVVTKIKGIFQLPTKALIAVKEKPSTFSGDTDNLPRNYTKNNPITIDNSDRINQILPLPDRLTMNNLIQFLDCWKIVPFATNQPMIIHANHASHEFSNPLNQLSTRQPLPSKTVLLRNYGHGATEPPLRSVTAKNDRKGFGHIRNHQFFQDWLQIDRLPTARPQCQTILKAKRESRC